MTSDVYHALNATSRAWRRSGIDHPLATTPVFLLGDSATGHIANRDLSMASIFGRYERFMYEQWLRVYMRSQMIKHNKDLLEAVGDTDGLAKLHIF